MASLTDTIEALLQEDESTTLDFKQTQYPFATANDDQKSELLKDILAFANTNRDKDAFIIIGAKEHKGHRATIIGINDHLDDAHLQQLVNTKTNRPITFAYRTVSIDEKQLGVIQIPVQERFLYLKKDFGKLRANIVYHRHGSSTTILTPDEIKRMALDDHPPGNDPERAALERLHERARFGDTIWHLMEGLYRHRGYSNITAPTDEYDQFKREQLARIADEHYAFAQDLRAIEDLLTAKHAIASPAEQAHITQLRNAMRDVRETVRTLVSASTERFPLDHTNERENARAAANTLSTLIAQRLVARGATP